MMLVFQGTYMSAKLEFVLVSSIYPFLSPHTIHRDRESDRLAEQISRMRRTPATQEPSPGVAALAGTCA